VELGTNIVGQTADRVVSLARKAEALGLHSLWRGEAYGGDAVVPLAWAAAHTSRIRLGSSILQIPARTPAMTAMTAQSLDVMSDGRFVLGLGMSGPQVVEGWHGVPYRAPLGTTEEYVAIVRRIFAGDQRVSFSGQHFQIPYHGADGTGLGKPLRPGLTSRADIPVYLAAIGPKNVALATRIADGLLPMLWNPYRVKEGFGDVLAGTSLATFAVAPTVPVAVGDDIAACRDKVRPIIGLYVGGMGARGRNFYNSLVRRYGFDDAADKIQDTYLDGRQQEAIALVPDELVDELALVGPKERVRDQLAAWQASGVSTLIIATPSTVNLETLAELVL
jgi:F420-dependent oxidoreductase-like protein